MPSSQKNHLIVRGDALIRPLSILLLIYFKDISPASPDFAMVQKMALAGYIPGWEARLDDAPTAAELEIFRSLSGMEIPSGLATRKEILQFIYDRL